MSQNLSLAGAGFLRHGEGFVGKWYADPVGVGTIGIGFTWASAGFREWWARNRPGQKFGPGATMTREEADKALIFLCAVEYGKAVNVFLNRAQPQHVFDAAVSAVFNMGPGSLKWKWAAALKERDYEAAASRLRETGVTAKGKKLRGLVIRRKEEAELLLHGDYAYGDFVKSPLADGVLVRGERGDAVADLQRMLAIHGRYSGEIDGIFGYGTEAAVLEFQRMYGLNADGFAGPLTLEGLRATTEQDTPPAPEKPASGQPKPKGDALGWVAGIAVFLGLLWTLAGEQLAAFWGWLGSLFT